MRIIYISKNHFSEETVRNNLQDLSEQESIAFFYSYSAAEDFISNNIIKNQIPLDLIITENNIDAQKATDFFQRICTDKKRTFSNRDFKFYSIPIVLILDQEENKNAFANYGFSYVINSNGDVKLHLFTSELIISVKDWRKKVLDELDNMAIKFNSGKVDYTYFFSEERKRDIDTDILSDNFKLLPRKLNYDWLYVNDRQIEKAIDLYIKELKRSRRLNNKKDEEKRFHKLFNKYPFFLKRDNYSKHWYQPRLHYEKEKWYEPDYTLQPNFNQQTDLSILEVKLPNERFIKKTKFHPSPYSSIMEHIFQVNDYKDYIESDKFNETIKKVFGFVPDSIEYNILIGRIDDKRESFKIMNKRMTQMNSMHINFITYDELLDYQVKYLERVKVLTLI